MNEFITLDFLLCDKIMFQFNAFVVISLHFICIVICRGIFESVVLVFLLECVMPNNCRKLRPGGKDKELLDIFQLSNYKITVVIGNAIKLALSVFLIKLYGSSMDYWEIEINKLTSPGVSMDSAMVKAAVINICLGI